MAFQNDNGFNSIFLGIKSISIEIKEYYKGRGHNKISGTIGLPPIFPMN